MPGARATHTTPAAKACYGVPRWRGCPRNGRRISMQRRAFMRLLGGATVGSTVGRPLAALAQGGRVPVIGYITAGSPEASQKAAAAFREGLGETGFVEGRNLRIEYRWA